MKVNRDSSSDLVFLFVSAPRITKSKKLHGSASNAEPNDPKLIKTINEETSSDSRLRKFFANRVITKIRNKTKIFRPMNLIQIQSI